MELVKDFNVEELNGMREKLDADIDAIYEYAKSIGYTGDYRLCADNLLGEIEVIHNLAMAKVTADESFEMAEFGVLNTIRRMVNKLRRLAISNNGIALLESGSKGISFRALEIMQAEVLEEAAADKLVEDNLIPFPAKEETSTLYDVVTQPTTVFDTKFIAGLNESVKEREAELSNDTVVVEARKPEKRRSLFASFGKKKEESRVQAPSGDEVQAAMNQTNSDLFKPASPSRRKGLEEVLAELESLKKKEQEEQSSSLAA